MKGAGTVHSINTVYASSNRNCKFVQGPRSGSLVTCVYATS